MTAQELRDKRGKAIADARALIDASGEKGLSKEDAAKYDAFMADAKAAKDQLERLAELEGEEAILKDMADSRNHAPAIARTEAPKPDEWRGEMRLSMSNRQRQAVSSPEYRQAFWSGVRCGFMNMGTEQRALQVGTDSEGGYLVPDEFERSIIETKDIPILMRPLVSVMGSVSGDKLMPIETSIGSGAWTGEEAGLTASDVAFGQKKFSPWKWTTLIKWSVELQQDAFFDLEGYIRRIFTRRSNLAEDAAFVAGNGAGKPLGLNQSGTAGVTAAAVDSVTADELNQLKYALAQQYRSQATWITADSTVGAISRLKDGNGQYLWRPGLTEGTPDTLLGRPIYGTTNIADMATGVKSVFFGDLSYYQIVDRAGIGFQILRELYAANGQVGALMYKRTDGAYLLDAAMVYITQA